MLFIVIRKKKGKFLGQFPSSSYKTTLKQQLMVKNKMQILTCFWFSCFVMLFWCPVFGSIPFALEW